MLATAVITFRSFCVDDDEENEKSRREQQQKKKAEKITMLVEPCEW